VVSTAPLDRTDRQRPAARRRAIAGPHLTALLSGARAANEAPRSIPTVPDVDGQLGRVLFTDYVVAFEITAVLLTIAVVGAVVLARRVRDLTSPRGPSPRWRREREPERTLAARRSTTVDATGDATPPAPREASR
jgi:hypothetical protein